MSIRTTADAIRHRLYSDEKVYDPALEEATRGMSYMEAIREIMRGVLDGAPTPNEIIQNKRAAALHAIGHELAQSDAKSNAVYYGIRDVKSERSRYLAKSGEYEYGWQDRGDVDAYPIAMFGSVSKAVEFASRLSHQWPDMIITIVRTDGLGRCREVGDVCAANAA